MILKDLNDVEYNKRTGKRDAAFYKCISNGVPPFVPYCSGCVKYRVFQEPISYEEYSEGDLADKTDSAIYLLRNTHIEGELVHEHIPGSDQ